MLSEESDKEEYKLYISNVNKSKFFEILRGEFWVDKIFSSSNTSVWYSLNEIQMKKTYRKYLNI